MRNTALPLLRAAQTGLLLALCIAPALAQQPAVDDPNTTVVRPDGAAVITRLVGTPTTLSAEAQAFLKTQKAWAPAAGSDEQKRVIAKARELYPVTIEESTLGGVKVKIVRPQRPAARNAQRVLLCIHGGGFVSDSGSFLESIPIAALTQTDVVAVDYRLAPAAKFPAQIDDVIAVYTELLKKYPPKNIGMYGTSAGAILTVETTARLRQLGLPLPAALGYFSGLADFTRIGDSSYFFGVPGLMGARVPRAERFTVYLGDHDEKDPVVSPIFADLKGWPPVLCMAGTRDMLLSGTANFHRALMLAGVETQLVVYDAMPHAHWYMVEIPEAREALEIQARWLDAKVGR